MYLGYLFIFAAALCWGFLGVFARIAMSEGVEPLEVAFWRAIVGGLILLFHAFCIKDIKLHSTKDLRTIVLFGIFSMALFFVAYQYAIKDGGVALASVLLYTAPVWVALFSRVLYGIALTKVSVIAIFLALSGVCLISFSSTVNETASQVESSLPFFGIFFGLLSGFLYATHYIVTAKYLRFYSAFTFYGYSSIIAALCILPFTSVSLNYSISGFFALLGTAFVSTYLAYWAYCEGIKRLHATKASVVANLEPVVATVAAWAIWNESFSLFGWFGVILILCTVFLLLYSDKKNKL